LPVLVHEAPETAELSRLQRLLAAQAEGLDVMQVLDHRLVELPRPAVLILEDRSGAARIAGEEEQQIVLEIETRLVGDLERLGIDPAGRIDAEAGDAAIGGDVLVLLADRLAQQVDLDMAGLLRELLRRHEALPVGMQRLEERGREAARGAEARTCPNVGHAGELEVRLPSFALHELDRL